MNSGSDGNEQEREKERIDLDWSSGEKRAFTSIEYKAKKLGRWMTWQSLFSYSRCE